MSYSAAHTPNQIVVNSDKDTLSLGYADGTRHTLAAEYLRVLSPSAEVRGHGTGQEVLQFGKRHVKISAIYMGLLARLGHKLSEQLGYLSRNSAKSRQVKGSGHASGKAGLAAG
jgi:hypothetical protein